MSDTNTMREPADILMFGRCPRCNDGTGRIVHVEGHRDPPSGHDYRICEPCGVYWYCGANLMSRRFAKLDYDAGRNDWARIAEELFKLKVVERAPRRQNRFDDPPGAFGLCPFCKSEPRIFELRRVHFCAVCWPCGVYWHTHRKPSSCTLCGDMSARVVETADGGIALKGLTEVEPAWPKVV